MKNLIRNILPYWKTVLILLLMLLVQAYCDLALPQYTQDIIDVGIQNKGIEHILPTEMTAEDYNAPMAVMTDSEKQAWQNAYEKDGSVYVLKTDDEEQLDKLDDQLLTPVVLSYQMEQMEAVQRSGDAAAAEKARKAAEQAGFASVTSLDEGRKQIDKLRASGAGQTIHAMGIAFAASAEKNAGVDVDGNQTHYLWMQGARMMLMTLLMFAAAAVASLVAARIGADIGRDLRGRVFRNVIGFSNAEMDQFSTASLITRATNDVQQVQMVSTMLLRMVLYAPVLGIWGIVKVAQTGAHMSYIIALAVLILVAFVLVLMSVTMPKFKIMQKLVDGVNLVSREILTGLSVIRAFGREKQAEERFDGANTELMKTQLFTNRVMALMQPSMMLIMYGLTVIITWVSAKRIDSGALQVGAMTAFITYSMMIVFSFLIITMMSILLPRAGVAADRIEEVIQTHSSIEEDAHPEDIQNARGLIEFDHVSFRYPGAEHDVLTDIDFRAEPGKTTAIIGSTGSGKTTLVNLIPRFFDATEGQVKVDGQDVRKLRLKELRGEIGFVPQKGVLFSGTIASNIRFGKEEATEEEITRAAETAQAMEFISEKEQGMESGISQGGGNVSGGQKQRLAIARAIARDPKILVFDDSFSALDMKTDAALRHALEQQSGSVTTIIVAQRISTILHADQILVLDEGRIVGRGTHDELMESCEVYQQIARSQLSAVELEAV